MSTEAIAIIASAVGLLGVLVSLMLYLHGRLAADLKATRTELHGDVAEVRRDLHAEATAIRVDLHALAERVARIEGVLTGPWRPPANASPATAAATSSPPETTA